MTIEVYGSTSGLDQYITDRGYDTTGLDTGDKGPALARGSMSLDASYEPRFVGTKTSGAQERSWPRTDAAYPDGTAVSGTPDAVILAAYEMAYQEWRKPGSTSVSASPGLRKKSARVEGAVSVEYWMDDSVLDPVMGLIPVNSVVEGLLTGLVGQRTTLPGIAVV